MIRKSFVWILATIFLTTVSAEAQQTKKIPRIGYLSTSAGETPASEAFRQGLRDLGYIEGQNIVVEYRWVDGKFDRLSDLAEIGRAHV